MTYNKFVEGIRVDAALRDVFIDFIAGCEFEAVNWELPPLTKATFEQSFEFVLFENRALATKAPDPKPFAEHFENTSNRNGVVCFPNLGKSAMLVVPCPLEENESYTHFASFIRNAPEEQVHALIEQVGHQIQKHLNDAPIWVSTAGLGVLWLHVRISRSPRYYRHSPYKKFAN